MLIKAPNSSVASALVTVPQGVSIWPACPGPESSSAPAALAGHSSAGSLTSSHTALPPRSAEVSQGNNLPSEL